jgi:hypothetical protein
MIGGHEAHPITGTRGILNPSPLAVKYPCDAASSGRVGELTAFMPASSSKTGSLSLYLQHVTWGHRYRRRGSVSQAARAAARGLPHVTNFRR